MRKAILVLALLATSVVAGSAGARSSATLIYCTDPRSPPMESAGPGGRITGFDIDMASELAKTFGATAKPLKTAFPRLLTALTAKKCNAVISGIFVTTDRLKQAGSVPYMNSHRVFIVRPGNPKNVTGPNSSLQGLNVVAQAGTKYEEYLKELQKTVDFNLTTYPGDKDTAAQVMIGRADVGLTQDVSFAFQARAHPGKLAVAYTFPGKDAFGIYFRKGDTLGKRLKSGVATLKTNGTLRRLAAKYKIPIANVQ